MLRVIREVGVFVRIAVMIVQLDAVFAFIPFGAAPARGADRATPEFSIGTAARLGESTVVNARRRILQQRAQARALQMFRRGNAAEIAERGIDIQQFEEAIAALAAGLHAWCVHDERNVGAFLKQAAFVP